MIHLRMSATEGWVSVTDALDYLWHKIYNSDPPEIDWSKRLPRSIFIKAYWPPAVKEREEFVGIHLDNLHILFDDPTYMVDDAIINEAISDFRSMVADPKSVKDDTYMIIVGDAKKTASQVRWQRDIREKLTQPDEYYKKKRARDDRHRVHRKKRKIGCKDEERRCTASTDHVHPQNGGGVNSPSMHRHLISKGLLSPSKCSCLESPRLFITIQPDHTTSGLPGSAALSFSARSCCCAASSVVMCTAML